MTPCIRDLSIPMQKVALGCAPATAQEIDLPTEPTTIPMLGASDCQGTKVGVKYIQYASMDKAAEAFEAVGSHLSLQERVWHSGAGSGRYMARTYDRIPELYWSYASVPVIGWVQTGQDMMTQDQLVQFWRNNVIAPSS